MALQFRYQQHNRIVDKSDPNHAEDDDDEEDVGIFTNRATIMANFEEWIKLATDNKITSKNSWNFALIDYFHDLNVLKDDENGNINFQRASATLDGCVKIYSSRVDSVATETGKLLTGLATDKNKNVESNDHRVNNGPNHNGAEDGNTNITDNTAVQNGDVVIDPVTGLPVNSVAEEIGKRRRNYNRILETTLTEFDNIKLKELDEELRIDPLFKKALSEFDEGGSKSLLLSTLNVDDNIRVIFDAIGTSVFEEKDIRGKNMTGEGEKTKTVENNIIKSAENLINEHDEDNNSILDSISDPLDSDDDKESSSANDQNISQLSSAYNISRDNFQQTDDDILVLGSKIITNLNFKNLCPSMEEVRTVVKDVSKAKELLKDVNGKFENFLTDQDLEDVALNDIGIQDVNIDPRTAMDDYDSYDNDNDDESDRNPSHDIYEFEENIVNKSNNLLVEHSNESNISDITNTMSVISDEGISAVLDMDALSYFDDNLKKSWRGRDHWKVTNWKKFNTNTSNDNNNTTADASTTAAAAATTTTTTTTTTNNNNVGDHSDDDNSSPIIDKKQIDFFDFSTNPEDIIFESRKKSRIDMPLKDRENETHYLLPNDFHFTADKITRLFIKPTVRMAFISKRENLKKLSKGGYKSIQSTNNTTTNNNIVNNNDLNNNDVPNIADENFWAKNYDINETVENASLNGDLLPDNDNSDNENNDDIIGFDFNDAFGDEDKLDSAQEPIDLKVPNLSEQMENSNGMNIAHTATSLPLRNPTEFNNKMTYSRVSKRVDVKKLKDNIWATIQMNLVNTKNSKEVSESFHDELLLTDEVDTTVQDLNFSDVVSQVTNMYGESARKDLSTSFFFICLLHLANEHGFKIQNVENYEDLIIRFQQ
ncbi:related to Condensin complex subunit 2 [Saccharomycodes ludwigii]|uniref:Condensin complex subunit 2 n=1 Tax=Saccharomycodes ludwigii TaxID=36035 RepID=A0A376B236_9ASCO|nr:related to Condensin complex subunit 2 [Saccharomycodes ludwigii]